MKKVLILFTLVLSLFALTACGGTEVADLEAELATAEAALAAAEGDVTALEADVAAAEAALAATVLADIPATLVLADANFDDYLGRPDVQYVDLRNFDDKLNSGYVAGFEFIPFFDYLEHEAVLSRTNGWTFEAAGIGNQAQLENLFDKDAEAIFLMCGSGTRAGFVLDALESIGYDNVINVMGLGSYTGDHKVLGDSTFMLNHPASGMYVPGTYFAMDPAHLYTATVVIGVGGAIEEVFFDAIVVDAEIVVNDNGTPADTGDDFDEAVATTTTKQALGFGYNMKLYSGGTYEWFEMANMLADAIVDEQGWNTSWVVIPGIDGGHSKFDVKDIADDPLTTEVDETHVADADTVDAVGGVTIGVEGFKIAFDAAISQARPVVAELYISEYIEGSGNNKAIEIYNPTDAEVDLSMYSINQNKGSEVYNYVLTGTLAAGEVVVLCTDQIDTGTALETNCDVQLSYPSVIHFNGDDTLQLLKDGVVIDQIGVEADAGDGNKYLGEMTLVRNDDVMMGNTVYVPGEWTVYDQNTYDYIGTHNDES